MKINAGIHPDFNLLGVDEDNTMWIYPIERWKAKVVERKGKGELPPEAGKEVSVKFLNVDVTGNAAMAKIEFYVGTTLKYIDYISLYKFDKK